MQLRLDRLDRVAHPGRRPGRWRVCRCGRIIAGDLAGRDVPASAVTTSGSVENARLLHGRLAEVALIQNDIAGMAARGVGPVRRGRADGASCGHLGSLFPEPIQVVVKANSPLASIADLKGKRVDLASAGSGTRANAEALLAAGRRRNGRSRLRQRGRPGGGSQASGAGRGRRGDRDGGGTGPDAAGRRPPPDGEASAARRPGAGDPDGGASGSGAGDAAGQHLSRPGAGGGHGGGNGAPGRHRGSAGQHASRGCCSRSMAASTSCRPAARRAR